MDVGRVDPPAAAGEKATLLGFLRFHRHTLVRKAAGLTAEQLRAAPTVSALSLAALLKHLAYVEESWLVDDFLGEPLPEPWASADWEADRDWELHSAGEDDPEWLVARYQEAWQRVDDIIDRSDLDALSVAEVRVDEGRQRVSLRWIVLHLIEETARHNGHADLIREALDGSTGE